MKFKHIFPGEGGGGQTYQKCVKKIPIGGGGSYQPLCKILYIPLAVRTKFFMQNLKFDRFPQNKEISYFM